MKKVFAVWLVVAVWACAVLAQTSAPSKRAESPSALASLVESERAFARTAAAKGIRQAFLDNAADDGLMFRPGPVNAKQSWRERAEVPGLLSWEPTVADVSRAGDLGYTTGPWEFREKPEASPEAFGNYVTLWRKQPDGTWKFVLDIGTQNPQPPSATVPWQLPASYDGKEAKPVSPAKLAAERAKLLQLEQEFAQSSARQGFTKAFAASAAEDVRLHRNKNFPAVGREAALAALAAMPAGERLGWRPAKADVANSGDLGYTYGTYELGGNAPGTPREAGNFLRIWRKQRDNRWRIVLDLLNPTPPPRPATTGSE